jgi:hypothetical protein
VRERKREKRLRRRFFEKRSRSIQSLLSLLIEIEPPSSALSLPPSFPRLTLGQRRVVEERRDRVDDLFGARELGLLLFSADDDDASAATEERSGSRAGSDARGRCASSCERARRRRRGEGAGGHGWLAGRAREREERRESERENF